MTQVPRRRPRVVILGGGFAGLKAARVLRKAPVDITLIDRRNFHLFQPLLYQVATGGLSPANIAGPIRSILRRQKNCSVRLGEAIGIDQESQQVVLKDGRVDFDWLIVATGATHSYFGNDQWQEWAPGLKTVEDATRIRRKVLHAFEMAEREDDPEERKRHLNFAVIGAGPTGVELAGAIAELRRHTLKHDFRNIDPSEARVILIDMQDRVLSTFDPTLSSKARNSLEKLGVELQLKTRVVDIKESSLTIEKDGEPSHIATRSVIWAAGVQASPLAKVIADSTGSPTDRAGRLQVRPDCSLEDCDNIFAIGDIACYLDQHNNPLPGMAPVAIQQGEFVAKLIRRRLKDPQATLEFQYQNPGQLATIGRSAAVAEIGPRRFSGYFAWLVWLVVHLMQIVQHQNRVLVFVQWAWSYMTFNRSARLITENQEDLNASEEVKRLEEAHH